MVDKERRKAGENGGGERTGIKWGKLEREREREREIME